MDTRGVNGLTFIDFCAGIGAGRLGLETLGLTCVAFSEVDEHAEATYREFFGHEEKNYGDLLKINLADLPAFDLLIAGFPCQPFSILGQRRGVDDARGQVIYGLIKILQGKNVPYFILENVKGLVNHRKGETLKALLEFLDSAGYVVFSRVLNSLHYGVPHARERLYFVGIRKDLAVAGKVFEWPEPVPTPALRDYLIDADAPKFDENEKEFNTFLRLLNNKYNQNQFKVEDLLKEEYLVLDVRQSALRLYRDKVPTLRFGRHGILYVKEGQFRKLTGFEALLLQGFPRDLAEKGKNKVRESRLLSQVGNAMTVNVVTAVGRSLLVYLRG